jgi:predicted nucleic acid-binding protein
MTLSYFDSSVLLAVLLDEKKQEEAYKYWKSGIRVSSILLKIETIITLRRTYNNNKNKLDNKWLDKKLKIFEEYSSEVNFMIINNKIEKEILSRKELALCKTLDAIHIATALKFMEINNNEPVNFYTFDKTMHNLAEIFNFNTNKII